MFTAYKMIENIPKGKFTHIILCKINAVSLKIIEENIKFPLGKDLKDENNNHFKVNGYYGKYMILRSVKLGTHPAGLYLKE